MTSSSSKNSSSSPSVDCFSCGATNTYVERLSLKEECEKCGEDLHCCRNCRFYDSGAYNECRESSADVVREKERANFCDYFQAGSGAFKEDKSAELKSAAEALFQKK